MEREEGLSERHGMDPNGEGVLSGEHLPNLARKACHVDMTNIEARLEARFGLGTRPELRRSLYRRLAALIEEEGEAAYLVVASAAADAVSKTNPGRYFAHVVMTRLQERGILPAPAI